MTISLIVALANLGFAARTIRVMTDEAEIPWDLPTKENIVRRLCEMSLLTSYSVQLRAMGELVRDARPHDSFFFYCT
jgi:hypothetical protein